MVFKLTESTNADISRDTKSAFDSGMMLTAGRHPLAATLERALFERCMFSSDSSLLIGCSGGADSTALSVLMAALARRRHPRITSPVLMHVDHGLRSESSRQAEQVRRLASRIGVDVRTMSLDMNPDLADLSATARRLRYAALHDVASELGCSHVACAHHAEDRFETIIHGLCRGVGTEALSNPRWCRQMDSVTLVRPFLGVSRLELRDFCHSLDLEFFDDPSNEDLTTMRGSLRDSVLPPLEERWPGASCRASAAIDRLSVAADSLERELSGILSKVPDEHLDLSTIDNDDPGFIAALVRKWILRYACSRGHDLRDRLASSLFEDIARAVGDQVQRPRSFECAAELVVQLRGKSLVIHLIGSD